MVTSMIIHITHFQRVMYDDIITKIENRTFTMSSVVMKYFVNDKFRLLYFLLATKGAACREMVL
jgi:hypothetical protein